MSFCWWYRLIFSRAPSCGLSPIQWLFSKWLLCEDNKQIYSRVPLLVSHKFVPFFFTSLMSSPVPCFSLSYPYFILSFSLYSLLSFFLFSFLSVFLSFFLCLSSPSCSEFILYHTLSPLTLILYLFFFLPSLCLSPVILFFLTPFPPFYLLPRFLCLPAFTLFS
jgi:hypothetical protein